MGSPAAIAVSWPPMTDRPTTAVTPEIDHRSITAELTPTERLERARRYVLLMRELRESAWGGTDGRASSG